MSSSGPEDEYEFPVSIHSLKIPDSQCALLDTGTERSVIGKRQADADCLRVLHTEVIKHGDPRESLFDEAKCKGLNGLLERGAFKVVLRSEAGENPNVVLSRFVLTIKNKNDGTTKYKARFAIGGFRDLDKRSLVHDSATVRPDLVRMLLALASIFGHRVSVSDSETNLRTCIYHDWMFAVLSRSRHE